MAEVRCTGPHNSELRYLKKRCKIMYCQFVQGSGCLHVGVREKAFSELF